VGSDGPWFPWPNIVGVVIYAVIVIKAINSGKSNHST
jgi:hypothetical protein